MLDRESRRKLYRWLWEDTCAVVEARANGCIEIRDDEGRQSEFLVLSRIEDFVDDVLEAELSAYRLDELAMDRRKLLPLLHAKYSDAMMRFFSFARADVQYSVRVQLFVDCWLRLKLSRDNLRSLGELSPMTVDESFKRFSDFITLIKTRANEPTFRKALYDTEKAAVRNALSATRYIERLWRHEPRLHVVALEFLYRDVVGSTVARAKQDLRRFLNNSRRKPTLFRGYVGHVWILRWNTTKGWHFYVYFFHTEATEHAGLARAADVGSYWEKGGTEGRGQWTPRYFTLLSNHKLQHVDLIRSTIREVSHALESAICFRVKPTGSGRCYGRAEENFSLAIRG